MDSTLCDDEPGYLTPQISMSRKRVGEPIFRGWMMARYPYTENQFKVLAAAFEGNFNAVRIDSRRAKTRAINDMLSAKLVCGGLEGSDLTLAGMRAYVDMCERYDADSGCIAYMVRAQQARYALRNMEAR